MNKTEDNICKVCGTHYAANVRRCPRCGCPRGGTAPAYLRCKRCGTVMPSSRKTCPGCGQQVTPQTAAGVLLPPDWAKRTRRRRWGFIAGVAVLAAAVTVEAFVVKAVYSNITYSRSLHLWNSGGSIEANRRAPDPVHQEVETAAADSLTDADTDDYGVDTTAVYTADTLGLGD